MNRIKNKNGQILNGIIPLLAVIAIIFALSTSNTYAQCCSKKGHGGHSGHEMQSSEQSDTTIIRKGKIDVYEIDLNMDGYVYQDPMDWNVISDKPGICPLCGMDLKKVTTKEAIKNLKEHNFEIKE